MVRHTTHKLFMLLIRQEITYLTLFNLFFFKKPIAFWFTAQYTTPHTRVIYAIYNKAANFLP
jgi:hypothetical protein